jgi:leucyl/phenylalanyl-tRNA--protein transferase
MVPRILSSLTPDYILTAYTHGYFPMANGREGNVDLFRSEPRGIVPLDERFTIRKSLRQALKREHFEIRIDTEFERVIRACARHDEIPDDEIWLSEEMIEVYVQLHKMGVAHSVETWRKVDEDDRVVELVGGLYGLVLGGAFCGESMYSTAPNASQAALVALVERLIQQGFTLLDAQMPSAHLKQFGLFETSHAQYMKMLNEALALHPAF